MQLRRAHVAYPPAFQFIGHRRIWDSTTGRCIKTIVDDDNPPLYRIIHAPYAFRL